jgi:hypothetical protein
LLVSGRLRQKTRKQTAKKKQKKRKRFISPWPHLASRISAIGHRWSVLVLVLDAMQRQAITITPLRPLATKVPKYPLNTAHQKTKPTTHLRLSRSELKNRGGRSPVT